MRLVKHCASRAHDCATKSLAANTAWIDSRMAAGAVAERRSRGVVGVERLERACNETGQPPC